MLQVKKEVADKIKAEKEQDKANYLKQLDINYEKRKKKQSSCCVIM
jgi:deoxyinosine 3'endonuclease (endonuclease V)